LRFAGFNSGCDRRGGATPALLTGILLCLLLVPGLLAQNEDIDGLKTATRAQSIVRGQLARRNTRQRKKAVAGSVARGEPLRTVRQIRSLNADQASESLPVRLNGIITDFSGFKNSFFLEDKTGGISIDRLDTAKAEVGDVVEITGVSNAGLFAPCVLASTVKVIRHGVVPRVRKVTYSDLFRGSSDSEWVEVEGVVHSVQMTQFYDHRVVELNLQFGSDPISVVLQDFSEDEARGLVDARVRLRGASFTDFNDKRQFVGAGLLVPGRANVEILQAANHDPYSAPLQPIRKALQFGATPHRVRVIGTVTYQLPGHVLYLQEGNDGIRIESPEKEVVKPGQRVEAVGFPSVGEYAPILESAIFRPVAMAEPIRANGLIQPLRVSADSMIVHVDGYANGPYDQQLVQLQGTVEESHVEAGQRVWLLRDGNVVFTAHLPVSLSSAERIQAMGNGSVLLLTGICSIEADAYRNPISFELLLRDTKDMVVLKRASWFTSAHTLVVLAAVGVVTILVLLWVVVLRHRVEQQTRMIKESEERFRNLAEHDFLTGLPNRFMLEGHFAPRLAECVAKGTRAAVFTIDIDRFKRINDTYGHLIGDECLKVVANRLKGIVRKEDIIARTGGEEFMMVVGGLPNLESSRRISSSVLGLFGERVRIDGHEIDVTVSVGGAIYPDDATETDTLRSMSDQALYEAKRTGRNRAVFISKELMAALEDAAAEEALDGVGRGPAKVLVSP
jgi:diguanylate cyclase (GGDEF)-like protein